MRFEAFVAARYLRSKRKTRFVSLISLISVAGVSVGVTALIVVMSVMTGFDQELMRTIIGNRAHLQIYPRYAGDTIEDPATAMAQIEELAPGEIVATSPYVQIKSVLRRSGGGAQDYEAAYVIGIDPERETRVTNLADTLTHKDGRQVGRGELPGKDEIVLGYILAENLGALVGDTIAVMAPSDLPMPGGRTFLKAKWLTVSGIAETQYTDFDSVYAYVDIETAARIKRQTGVDGIQVRLEDLWEADEVAERIRDHLGYGSVTWYESQRDFFEALVQEKVALFIILLFIVLVAAFNIASTLIMIVMEKRRDIGILRTIGVSGAGIMRVFMIEGLYIGFAGTLMGFICGMALAYNLNPVAEAVARLLGLDVFNSVIYGYGHIPVAVVPRDVALITVSAFALTFISTLYPAWSAARLDPVDALRYE